MYAGILSTLAPIVSVPLQPVKGEDELLTSSQFVALKITSLNPVQFSNAELPIVVTEFGIVRLPVKPLQP